MANKNFAYFKQNHEELFEKFPNRYLIIIDEQVKGDFATMNEALDYAEKNFELGSYIVQYCSEGTAGYTQHFHTRVIFA